MHSETAMLFFRRERRFVWVALIALVAQFTLSFGHVHIHSIERMADAAASSSCVGPHAACPSHHDDNDAHCSVCWALSIAGSSIVPTPAAFIIPLDKDGPDGPKPSIGTFADKGSVQFQARAPPCGKTFA